LVGRGVTLSVGLLAGALTANGAPAAWRQATVQTAVRFAAGQGSVTPIPASVPLAEEMLRAMFWVRLKVNALLVLAAGLLTAGAGWAARGALDRHPEPTPPDASRPAAEGDVPGLALPPGALARLGTDRLRHVHTVTSLAFSR